MKAQVGPVSLDLALNEEEGHCGIYAVKATSLADGELQLFVQLPDGLLRIYTLQVRLGIDTTDYMVSKAWRGDRYDLRARFLPYPPPPLPLFERPTQLTAPQASGVIETTLRQHQERLDFRGDHAGCQCGARGSHVEHLAREVAHALGYAP